MPHEPIQCAASHCHRQPCGLAEICLKTPTIQPKFDQQQQQRGAFPIQSLRAVYLQLH